MHGFSIFKKILKTKIQYLIILVHGIVHTLGEQKRESSCNTSKFHKIYIDSKKMTLIGVICKMLSAGHPCW